MSASLCSTSKPPSGTTPRWSAWRSWPSGRRGTHRSRRAFREVLPNCRLVTVERHLRGVGRVDDIPSRFIPRAYHEFVHTKDARIMRNVAYHNRMDLFTMAVILNRLSDPPAVPSAATDTSASADFAG